MEQGQIPEYTHPLPRSVPTEPPAEFARLRDERPVCPIRLPTGPTAWLVTRYEDTKTVLSDPRFSRAALFRPGAPRAQVVEPDPDSILSMDPPRHTRIRKLANHVFTPRRVERLRPRIAALAEEILTAMAGRTPPVDLNEHFSRPLALRVICELLGVPFEDHGKFGSWCDHFVSLTKYTREEMIKANGDMRDYFVQLIDAKRRDPGPDLLSALVPRLDEGSITQSELVSLGALLLLAGHDTTVTVLGGATLALLRHRDQLELLLRNPELFPAAVEELIRMNEPGDGSFLRIALADVRLGDTVVPAGDAVIASISSADRDAAVFKDPDRLDVLREDNPHLGFGHGPHFCLGAGLARAELEIGLRTLFTRLPGLRPAIEPHELRWKHYAHLGGWEELPVTW
ncbi:MAG TPA: cytochrome P450 [Streptosporangiaceae bacterium]